MRLGTPRCNSVTIMRAKFHLHLSFTFWIVKRCTLYLGGTDIFGFTVLSEAAIGMSRVTRYPFTYTVSKAAVEAQLRKEWGEAAASYDNPDFLDRLYDELKRPWAQGWNHVSVAYTLDELRGFIAEGRNVGLKFQQWVHPSRPARLLALDIDEESAAAREVVDALGDVGALVFKTRDGYHVLFVAEDGLVLKKNRYDKGFCISSWYYKVKAEAYVADERSKIEATKQIILPVVGTPRAELFGCTVLYDRGQKVDRAYTLEELVEAIDALIIENCVISFEDAVEVDKKLEYSSKDSLKSALSQERGLWKQLFGDDYYKDPNIIYEAVRNAPVGTRNPKVFNAAKALVYLSVPEDEIREKLTEISKQIFTYKDPECSGGTFEKAINMIERGISKGKEFLDTCDKFEYKPRDRKVKANEQEGEREKLSKSEKKVRKVFDLLASSGAKILKASTGEYLLHLSNAVSKNELSAYIADKFNEFLNDSQVNTLSLMLSSKLRHLDEANDDIVILGNIIREILVGDTISTYAYVTIIKRYLDTNDASFQENLEAAIRLMKNKFYDLCKEGVDEFIDRVNSLSDDFRTNYVVSVKLDDKLGFVRTNDLSVKDSYDVTLCFKKYDKDTIIDDTGKVYVRYNTGKSKRTLSIAQLIEVVALNAVFPEDRDAAVAKAKQVMECLNAILSLQDYEIMLFNSDDLRKTYLWYHILGVSRFHSYNILKYTPKEKRKNVLDFLTAKTLLSWVPTVFLPGVLLIEGISGAGKSYFGSELSHTANGEDGIIDPTDPKNVGAGSNNLRTMVFEEGNRISKKSQNRSKVLTSEFSYYERKLFSNSDVVGFGRGKISIIIVTTDVENLEHDMVRRMFRVELAKSEFEKYQDRPSLISKRTGLSAIYTAILNSLVFSSVLKLKSDVEINMTVDELFDSVRSEGEPDEVTQFVLRSNNPKAAIVYHKLCQYFDISFELMKNMFYESRIKAALAVMPKNWIKVYDFYMLCKKGVVQNEKEDYLTKFFDGMTGYEIADALAKQKEISPDKVNDFARSLSDNARKVGNIFFQLGIDFRISKVGRANKYKLKDLQSGYGSISEALYSEDIENLSEENYIEEYEEEKQKDLLSDLPDDVPF